MSIPIFSIVIALIIVSLVLWVNEQLASDAMIKQVIRVVIVVLFVLWVVGMFTGHAPTITFR